MYQLLLVVILSATLAVAQGGYARPAGQQYPWTSYSTERSTDLENLQGATPSDLAQRIQPVTTSSSEVGIKGGSSSGSTRPLGHGHRTPCGPYPWTLCQAGRRRLISQSETSGTKNNNNKDEDNSLETSASENTFSIGGPGLLDNRIYGPNGNSYHGFSSYRDPINGQTFIQRTYVSPPAPILLHRPHNFGPFVFLHPSDPARKIVMFRTVHGHGHGCNKCGGSVRPRVPAIYRTSTTEGTVEKVKPVESSTATPYPQTTSSSAESSTSNPQFGSGESSELDTVTTAEPPTTTVNPDYDNEAESV